MSFESRQSAAAEDSDATIVRQQAEIERLQRLVDDGHFAQDLRDALTAASTTWTIGAPVSYDALLDMVVATAADIVEANAASIFMIDLEGNDLVFEAALGDRDGAADEFRVPMGQGIAGLVAQSGEPMAISDTADDDLDTSDVAQAVGYVPKSILCVPLSFQDRTIGVLEILDKQSAAAFSGDDLEAVALFANISAVAIEQCRSHHDMGTLLVDLIRGVDGLPDYDRHGLTQRARDFTTELGTQSGYLGAMELARLVCQIARHGDRATAACAGILGSFARFLDSQPRDEEGGGLW